MTQNGNTQEWVRKPSLAHRNAGKPSTHPVVAQGPHSQSLLPTNVRAERDCMSQVDLGTFEMVCKGQSCDLANLNTRMTFKWVKDGRSREAGFSQESFLLLPAELESISRVKFPTTFRSPSNVSLKLCCLATRMCVGSRGRGPGQETLFLPKQKENCSFSLFQKNTFKMTS